MWAHSLRLNLTNVLHSSSQPLDIPVTSVSACLCRWRRRRLSEERLRCRNSADMSEDAISVIERLRIFEVRGQAVVLDSDLAAVYGVQTKVFNQAIKRSAVRFPDDFLLRLAAEEWTALRSQLVTFNTGGRGEHRKCLPLVFTEHGAIMASTILNSPRAVAMSVYVVRAFVRLRNELLANTTLESAWRTLRRRCSRMTPHCGTFTRRSGPCCCRRPLRPGAGSDSRWSPVSLRFET